MFRKKTLWMLFVFASIGAASAFYCGKALFSGMPQIVVDPHMGEEGADRQTLEKKPDSLEEETAQASTEQKITPSTKIVYEYYYPEDGILETQEEEPPYFLLDLTLSDLLLYYPNWKIISFSDREVVMRKEIEGQSRQHYIVGVSDGYIAVFYEQAQNGVSLHELTDTPVASLNHEEQVRLNDGIYVVGDEELARVMENYGS